MGKSVIDFILKYAESIRKEEMTSFHLLYAYACFCIMPVKDICEELELGEESYGKVSYLQGKINSFFDSERVKIDPVKLQQMILQQIDCLEQDNYAREDYKTAVRFLNNMRELSGYQEEAIVYSLLQNLIFNNKKYNTGGMNQSYLMQNKKFMLEKPEKKEEIRVKESIEDIAGISGRLYDVLSEKIKGQDMAIQKLVKGYVNSRLTGQNQNGKPAASYLFAGPPGVGKTYLASLFAEVQSMPFKRLDMSEYANYHDSDGLVGFEPTYREARPGVLTPFIMENPASVLLIDEIEKAHSTVKMLFLQVLEGARLYDKYYEKEVSFENVIIIFTTNCGKSLYQDNEEVNLSALAEGEVLEALKEDEAFPNELCSRFASGNIIMFNHLQQEHLCSIIRSKIDESIKDIGKNYNIQITYDQWLPEVFLFQMGGEADARIASGRGAEILKDCVISWARDSIEKQGKLTVNEVAVEICEANKEMLMQQIHDNFKYLSKKRQCVEYKIRYFTRENIGIIEFYDLSLRDIEINDAALRRKAKSSKVFDFERPKMRFSDIIGAKQAKSDFQHFINYMNHMEEYVSKGAQIPRGILLYGPPGTGKTSLAKAFAGECEALFLNTTGAGIRNSANPVQEIKDLFQIAYASAPAILFIDEIDVIAKERTGHDTMQEMLVNTLLTEMEGFYEKDRFKPVFVVAATNYNVERNSGNPYEVVIDPALVRRFDNSIYVGLPGREERKEYLRRLLEQKNYENKISEIAVDYAAEHTGGKSLAFLKRVISNMTNAAIDMQKEINDDLLTDTLERQLYGEKRENDEEYRLSVARHEAGHAYVGFKTGRKPKFITIVSRGNFGGYVSYGDGEDVHNLTQEDFLNYICQMLSGRAAEIVYYGERGINTGAGSDLEKATKYAIKMICHFGMGSMGLLSLNPESVLDSPKGTQVLEEAGRILDEQLQRAVKLIKEGKAVIDKVVSVLMDKSYIQGENLTAILEEEEKEAAPKTVPAKRNRKWYVVINGRKPGIYTNWDECQAQVKGYKNAIYRSYKNEEEAKKAFETSDDKENL